MTGLLPEGARNMTRRRLLPLVGALLTAAGAWSITGAVRAQPAPYDLLIRGGRVVDGTGNPWFFADVAIQRGRIAAVGRIADAAAARIIDARGMVVAPGFTDPHPPPILSLLADGPAKRKVRHPL